LRQKITVEIQGKKFLKEINYCLSFFVYNTATQTKESENETENSMATFRRGKLVA
jgi:hypothetical protein